MTSQEAEDELITDITSFEHDPLGYVEYAYPWGEGELGGETGPREWQEKVLDHIGKKLRNPKTRFEPIQIAVASGHGIGKSALISQIINWGMSTCVDCKVVVTANTKTQLLTKTWPEVTKWTNLSINSNWFQVVATSLYSSDKKREKTWRAEAITWSENHTEAFAGLHNKKKRIILIFDEASAIANKVWEVAEGALTDEETEIIWLAFGNPTRNTGRFRECFRKFKHRWFGHQIDSRSVEGTNKEQIKKWIEDYGEDSDFCKIRVRGIFPKSSFKQFISEEDVDAAFGKHLRDEQFSFAPKIIAVEPSWEGDDEFVIGMRQGLVFKILGTYPKNDNDVHMANIVANFEDQEEADAVFIDGGFGTGILSVGKTLNRRWLLVWFGAESSDIGFLNKRAEMWGLAKRWLKEGGSIPPDPLLQAELQAPETVARLDGKIQLESKKDMKTRGVPSPNRADCLAITFAFPVQPKNKIRESLAKSPVGVDYKPLERR